MDLQVSLLFLLLLAVPLILILWDVRDRQPQCSEHRYERALVNWTKVLGLSTLALVLATGYSAYVLNVTDHTLRATLEKSQRPWVVAEKIERVLLNTPLGSQLCPIGYRVTIRNTGNSIATGIVSDSRAVRFPPTWDWLKLKVDKLADDTIKLWAAKRPKGLPVGIALAPNQAVSPLRCPSFGDGADPTSHQIQSGEYLIIGYIQYIDQHGLIHRTRFAFNPDSDSVRPWDGQTYVMYNDYQESD